MLRLLEVCMHGNDDKRSEDQLLDYGEYTMP